MPLIQQNKIQRLTIRQIRNCPFLLTLSYLPKDCLVSLHLSNCQLVDDDVKYLNLLLTRQRNLTELDLSYNSLTDQGIRGLNFQETRVRRLDLTFNRLMLTGVEFLLKYLGVVDWLRISCVYGMMEIEIKPFLKLLLRNHQLLNFDLYLERVDGIQLVESNEFRHILERNQLMWIESMI